MEAERLLYMFAMILPAFGLVRLVWERKLEVSRKAVTGTNAFSSTVLGGIVGTGALWKLTGSYIYAAAYAAIIVVCYGVICVVVKKKEYPEEERFTKEE